MYVKVPCPGINYIQTCIQTAKKTNSNEFWKKKRNSQNQFLPILSRTKEQKFEKKSATRFQVGAISMMAIRNETYVFLCAGIAISTTMDHYR